MKKGIIIAVCLLMAASLTACSFTVNMTPEDITAIGGVVKDIIYACPDCADGDAYDPYVCPGCGQYTGVCAYCGQPMEGMAYREGPEDPDMPAEMPEVTGNTDAEKTENANVGMPNPIKECSSLEEINAAAGTALVHPAVMGVTDESFCTITGSDCVLADYDFSLVGYRWCFRAGAVAAYDISGVYINGAPAFGEPKDGIEYAEGEGYKLARWFTLDGQYVLSVADNGKMEQDTFAGIAEEMKDLSDPAWSAKDYEAYYAGLTGLWQDEIAQRATMTVTAEGSECVHIGIEWGNGYAETYRWTMAARVYEDGLLCYKDCTKEIVTFAEDGTAAENVVYTDGEGFFSLSPLDGMLYWNGASEPECTETAFKHIPTDENASGLVGYWYDNFSDRAMMSVEAIPGSKALHLQVNWASSAFEDTVWVMTATFDEKTGRLSYTDCEKTDIVLHENEEEQSTLCYKGGCGYFQYTAEGFLAWDGAPDRDCRDCVFALAVG